MEKSNWRCPDGWPSITDAAAIIARGLFNREFADIAGRTRGGCPASAGNIRTCIRE